MKSTTMAVIALIVAAIVIGGAACVLQGGSSGERRSITVEGSTTVLPIATSAAEKWMNDHPNDSITVKGGGSGVGIKSLIAGTCDIADASRKLKSEEIKRAQEKGMNLIPHEIAKDAVCVVVHTSNPVTGLTIEQVRDIFSGKITNWSQVGGSNQEIAVYTRESTSGTYETFHELVMKKEHIKAGALTKNSNGEMAEAVKNNPSGIGYVGIGYLLGTPGLKGLTINGVEPSATTVKNGTYPISRSLYMITNGEPKGLIKDFIEFVKSSEGQKIVEEEGFVSL